MANRGKWLVTRAQKAEEHLKSFPPEKLGPAGKILVYRTPKSPQLPPPGAEGGRLERKETPRLPMERSI